MKHTLVLLVLLCCMHNDSVSQVKSVESVSIVVSDMNTAVDFYSRILSFQKVSDDYHFGSEWEQLYGVFGLHLRKVRLQLGDEQIELIDYLTTGGREIPEDAKSNDLWFQHIAIVVSNMDSAYALLRKNNIEHVSTSPQTLPASIPEAAGIKAFYFHDRDDHNLELIYFPQGKGQPKWQKAQGRLFLGIDHTAIGVSSTATSHLFYSGMLGIQRKGESRNKGIEQAHLNNIRDASLHITGYRAAKGVGVEFLQYIHPGPGRKYPGSSRSDDLWQWVTNVDVDDAQQVYDRIKRNNAYQLVSEQLVTIEANGEKVKTFIVRDPDGHAVKISSRI
jgi:catechol 2,3-dioxygenase-like lactoylglutathione lyase family enzyme